MIKFPFWGKFIWSNLNFFVTHCYGKNKLFFLRCHNISNLRNNNHKKPPRHSGGTDYIQYCVTILLKVSIKCDEWLNIVSEMCRQKCCGLSISGWSHAEEKQTIRLKHSNTCMSTKLHFWLVHNIPYQCWRLSDYSKSKMYILKV